MLAISNSWDINPAKRLLAAFSKFPRACRAAAWIGIFVCQSQTLTGQTYAPPAKPGGDHAQFAAHAEKAYQTAKARFAAQTNNPEAQWQFGRACYDWADMAPSDHKREEIAGEGIAACNLLIASDPKSVRGHYYLSMDLGELAETKELGALKLVRQMETEFKTALELDPQFDHAGADRGLGLLYLQAPGWPASIGSKSRARQHLQKALTLAPDYPDNVLNLIEAELKWGDKTGARRDLKTLDELWPAALKKFTGEDWAASWADWETRRDAAKKKASAKATESPRTSD